MITYYFFFKATKVYITHLVSLLTPSRSHSPSRFMSPRRMSGEKDWENGSTISSPASIPEYTGWQYVATTIHRNVFHDSKLKLLVSVCFVGPKLYKEPSFKSNKFIIHNAITRCCLAGKVNEPQKNKIVEVSSPAVSPPSGYTNFSVSCS